MTKEKIKDVMVMKFGLDLRNDFYEADAITLPDVCLVSVDFDETKIVGTANNFRKVKEGIICDLMLNEKVTDTIAPSLTISELQEVKLCKGVKLRTLSFIKNHVYKDLNGNVGNE